jgi:enoyl-CoA hydratase/carnithine racemase
MEPGRASDDATRPIVVTATEMPERAGSPATPEPPSTIAYEVDDRVAVVTLDRPGKLNAIDHPTAAGLRAAIARADADPEVRVVVLRGAGERAFSAGYDIGEQAHSGHDLADWSTRLRDGLDLTLCVWDCSKPVIAMIHGYCLAGGLELAQMCDVRLASDQATFGVTETRFSAGVATLVMPWIIGTRARDLIYTGDMFDARTALELGLVSRIHDKATLEPETMRFAKRMARVALATLRWNKRAINQAYELMGFRAALQAGVDAATLLSAHGSPEQQRFNEIRSEQGFRAAVAWRDSLFEPFETSPE